MSKTLENINTWFEKEGSSYFASPLTAELQSRTHDLVRVGSFPSRRDEEWRYTPIKSMLEREISTLQAVDLEVSDIEDLKQIIPDALHLVFIDSKFSPAHSEKLDDINIDGLHINLITNLDDRQKRSIDALVSSSKFSDENIFQQLSLSMTRSGLLIEVDKNVEVSRPIHVINHVTHADSAGLSAPLLFVHQSIQSKLAIIQHFSASANAESVTIPAEYLRLEEGSSLTQYHVGVESMKTDHVSNIHASIASSARFVSHQYLFGAHLSRRNLEVEFTGAGAEARLGGLYLGSQDQHLEIRTYVNHAQPNCVSDQHFRGILGDSSRGVFNGLVMVQKGAQQTNAQQSNKNLLLSRAARADTKPQLEIYADDVRCGHGATVGELDADALFYLQSRGIDREEAAQMLIHAFAAEVTQDIELPALKHYVDDLVQKNLGTR